MNLPTPQLSTLSLHDALPIYIVNYHPPCFIVTHGQEGLEYLTRYCTEEEIPLLRTTESTAEFIPKLDAHMIKMLSEEIAVRSEEHTSELQSRGHLVCRLLLEQ